MLIYYTILIVLIVTGCVCTHLQTEDVITFASLDYDVHVVVPQDEEVELTEEGYIVIDEQIYVPFIERTVNLHDI